LHATEKPKDKKFIFYEILREKREREIRNQEFGQWSQNVVLKRGILPFFALEDVRGSSKNPLFLQDREPVNLTKPLQAKR
jgi:hypothetical protein